MTPIASRFALLGRTAIAGAYCSSYTLTALNFLPSAPTPPSFTVETFPSFETSVLDIAMASPPFFKMVRTMLELTRVMATVSAPPGMPLPVTGLSVPSELEVKRCAIGLPSASTPENVYAAPAPSATTVRVRLLGAGIPSNFDLDRFNFQVPTKGLLCAGSERAATAARVNTHTSQRTRFIRLLLEWTGASAPQRCAQYVAGRA